MPTLPPKPIEEPRDEMERIARMGAVSFIEKLCQYLCDYVYSTRSHVPGGMDSTDLEGSINQVLKFAMARPDWTLHILNKVMVEYGPNYAPQIEMERLQRVVSDFESESGLKLEEYGWQNGELAKAVKVVVEAGSPGKAITNTIKEMESMVRKLNLSQEKILETMDKIRGQ